MYIEEAHPSDGRQAPANERDGVVYQQPTTATEREVIAEACMLHLALSIPTLLDEMANNVCRAYNALPDRLYLIDAQGQIAFRSMPGPMGFIPDELEAAIQMLLTESAAAD